MNSPVTSQPLGNAPDSNESQAKGPAVPMWLIILMFLLLYGGAVYFDAKGGWFNARVYAPYGNLEEVQSLQPVSGGSEVFEFGRAIYNRPTCSACHQASGQGSPGQFPSLVGTDWVLEPEPGRLIRAVLHGLQGGPIKINGESFSFAGAMVPWKDSLKDDEIAAVLTYVRQEWGNKAPAVTTEQVKAVREKTKSRASAFTPDELMAVPPSD